MKARVVLALMLVSCTGSSSNGNSGGNPLNGDGGPGGGGCRTAECYNFCPSGERTVLHGTVTAPNGVDPIPGAAVYVPQAISEFPGTVTCEICKELDSNAKVKTTTGPDGSFVLEPLPTAKNQPAGTTVQVVAQKGRFRRVVDIPIAAPCGENDADDVLLRLPGRRDQYPNTIPNIAVVTGDYDIMECVLLELGVENGQFDLYEGGMFQYASTSLGNFEALLHDPQKMSTYNIIFINCTNDEFEFALSDASTRNNIQQYVANGGRLYVTDWSYDYLEQIEAFAPIIDFAPGMSGNSPETQNAAALGNDGITTEAEILDPGLSAWLEAVENRTGDNVFSSENHVHIEDFLIGWVMQLAVPASMTSKVWLRGEVSGMGVSGNLPLTTTFDYQQCGRGLYSSYHTKGRDLSDPFGFGGFEQFPDYCHTDESLSPQERVLEYLILHVADCLTIE